MRLTIQSVSSLCQHKQTENQDTTCRPRPVTGKNTGETGLSNAGCRLDWAFHAGDTRVHLII